VLDIRSQLWEHIEVTVYGVAAIQDFGKRYAAARKPLARFLAAARGATWKHFPDVKQTLPATDYAPATGTLIFNIGGNKYRLIAQVNFQKQAIVIDRILSHEEYNREDL
jgi:mRNA interferase HigB